jgi:hypothetical protein
MFFMMYYIMNGTARKNTYSANRTEIKGNAFCINLF